uniref:Uncharacterized protein n=1 Tax=Lepeophtheirus salmonis TaxID=72036 RepID=A0A0K2UYT0_LEPSM
MLEYSYAKTHVTTNKEDYPEHETQNPFSLDIFIQESPEIEVLTNVTCFNRINLVGANKFLSAKIQHPQSKLTRNKPLIMST